MSTITIFSGTFCKEDAVIQKVLDHTGYRLITDKDLVAEANRPSGMSEGKIMRAFSAKASVFNKFTHEKERSIAHIRYALAESLLSDSLLVAGFTGHLIPRKISHVLRICLIADMKSRISVAVKENGFTEKEAIRQIHSGHTFFSQVMFGYKFRVITDHSKIECWYPNGQNQCDGCSYPQQGSKSAPFRPDFLIVQKAFRFQLLMKLVPCLSGIPVLRRRISIKIFPVCFHVSQFF